MTRSILGLLSILGVLFGLILAPLAYCGSSPTCELDLTPDHLKDLFGHAQLGKEFIEYMQVLGKAVEKIEADTNSHAKAFQDPEFKKKFDLIQYYRTAIFPLLQRYHSNSQLQTEDLDRDLKGLADEEKDQLLLDMEIHNENLLPTLLTLAGLSGDSVIVELSKEKNQRIEAEWTKKIFDMYHAFARQMNWKFEALQISFAGDGKGIKNALFRLTGKDVFQFMMFESGLHRMMHAGSGPVTHTNQLKVTVYKEPPPREFSFNFSQDVVFKTARGSGPGGQHVNKTESAVRAKHIPTGIEVNIDSERSQHNNKSIALAILRAKVYERHLREEEELRRAVRDGAVGFESGDRYIRTYDERQNRVELASILAGYLGDYIRVRQREFLAKELPSMTQALVP